MSNQLLEASQNYYATSNFALELIIIGILTFALSFLVELFKEKTHDKLDIKYKAKVEEEQEKEKSELESEGNVKLQKSNINEINKILMIQDKLDSILQIVCKILIGIAAVLLVGGLFLGIGIQKNTGGNFSDIIAIEQSESTILNDIQLNAYYLIKYEGVDNQVGLAIFVKNNTKERLESAKITEVNTQSSVIIEDLRPGEEKIITINTTKNDEYSFEITDTKFIEK